MNELLSVTFDGSELTPDKPLKLERNKRYLITIIPEEVAPVRNAWDLLENLTGTVEAPEDWSVEHKGIASSLVGIAKTNAPAPTDEEVKSILETRLLQK
ncbi:MULTISPECIES: hypothetical protein [Pseudanabaena]|jgi:hypothetical protein|uniref:hypothetical protein n=1 Tax=Pseudanabaena TaxID=1152 RepID=UPI002478C307|nr:MULTISPECIES: hypothetical protein [Pseudanabaena]MEA5490249.1 hypothetical protein [Pseudanabaena sp. CCNP1317]WGS71149.1 hypothetical protein OA858_15655 [Pseudanabaena galeata CCNP1313]